RRFSRPVHSTTLPSLHRVLDPIDIVLLYVATRYVVLLICGCKGSSFLFNLQNFSPLFFEKHEKKNIRTRFVACVSDFSNSKYLISNALCAPILAKANGKADYKTQNPKNHIYY
ncbi:hypothetical protein, partial [Prevotella merdae]|uniref:hypothetical protein n=1 Tax=Prevotella merdae TaxID=2079531 RepID=UPI003F81AEC1